MDDAERRQGSGRPGPPRAKVLNVVRVSRGDAGCLDVCGRFGGIGRRTLGGRTAYGAKFSWARAAGVNIQIVGRGSRNRNDW